MDWQTNYNELVDTINRALPGYLGDGEPALIYEAMGYSLLGGGKRLRPAILLACAAMHGGEPTRAMPFACALEMIHCYSLIHDDLPAMDDDDMRRGQPANHIKFGEGLAILAGDGLLNRAYEVMAAACLSDNNPENLEAMAIISKCAGAEGMIGGQVLDIFSNEPNEAALLEIHTKKTAKLFIAAFVAGAHIGGADIDTIKRFEKIGEKFGILFQIQDDLQDMTGYANIFGEKKTRATLKALNIEVLALLEQEKNSQFFTDLVNYLTSERS